MTLFISLLFDKGIEAFSVGLQISRSNRKRVMFVVITIITYALMTPVGAMIGVALQVTGLTYACRRKIRHLLVD